MKEVGSQAGENRPPALRPPGGNGRPQFAVKTPRGNFHAIRDWPLVKGFYLGANYGERGRKGVPPREIPNQFVPLHGGAKSANGKPPSGLPDYAPNDLAFYATIPVPTSYMCMGSFHVLSDMLTVHEPRVRSAGLQTRLDDAYFETSRVGDRRSGAWAARRTFSEAAMLNS